MNTILIKRHRVSTYQETNIYCTEDGQEIFRESNVAKQLRYGTKQVELKGQMFNATWQRVNE